MYKYFFKLEYIIFYFIDEIDNERVEEIFQLGYYSTKNKALKKIEELKNKQGFKEYGINNFLISKERVDVIDDMPKEKISKLFRLSYEYFKFDANQEQENFIYYFPPKVSLKEAIELKKKLQKKKKYKQHKAKNFFDFAKDGFCVDKVYVDECASLFSKGFIPEPTELEKSKVKEK